MYYVIHNQQCLGSFQRYSLYTNCTQSPKLNLEEFQLNCTAEPERDSSYTRKRHVIVLSNGKDGSPHWQSLRHCTAQTLRQHEQNKHPAEQMYNEHNIVLLSCIRRRAIQFLQSKMKMSDHIVDAAQMGLRCLRQSKHSKQTPAEASQHLGMSPKPAYANQRAAIFHIYGFTLVVLAGPMVLRHPVHV